MYFKFDIYYKNIPDIINIQGSLIASYFSLNKNKHYLKIKNIDFVALKKSKNQIYFSYIFKETVN